MRNSAPLLLLLLLAGCGEVVPPTGPKTLHVRLEGVLSRTLGTDRTEVPYEAEHVLVTPDRLASRIRIRGLVKTRALSGDSGWLRVGAIVTDLAGEDLADAKAWRDDLRRYLEAGPGGTWPAPTPREGFKVKVTGRLEFPGGVLPATFEQSATREVDVHADQVVREALELRFADPKLLADGASPLRFDRPDDDPSGAVLGEIEMSRARSTDVLVVVHRGPLTDLAQVDLYLEEALRKSLSQRRGPTTRTFLEWPDAEGIARIRIAVPVALSRDPAAENLPSGVRVERQKAEDVIEADLTAPFPRDDRFEVILREKAEAEGLVLTAPPRYSLLSDPVKDEPGLLRQRMIAPVRKAE